MMQFKIGCNEYQISIVVMAHKFVYFSYFNIEVIISMS